MGKPIKIRARLKDNVAEVKALMPHEMESGLRRDAETGEKVPAHFITEVVAEHNGEVVMTAFWGPAVSKNPYLSFSVVGAALGDTIKIQWKDNKGDTSDTETVLD